MPTPIAQLLIAPPIVPAGSHGPVSIGVALDDNRVYWGDCLLIGDVADQFATTRRLIDLSTPALIGQYPAAFRPLCERIRGIFPQPGVVQAADATRGALQQALLGAVAGEGGVAEVLAREYGLSPLGSTAAIPSLYVEIGDFAATAERIDRILALRPDGIGYRLTGEQVGAAIGENGEHLQRFVRELGRRAAHVTGDNSYHPAIYLGLNGALGRLIDDPVRHIGKVLGNCVGLQEAAGPRRLLLEEPFLLDDPIAQSANLRRLKEFIRRTPSSQKRDEPPLLVARGLQLSDEDLSLYCDTHSVHVLAFDPLSDLDIDKTMTRLATLGESVRSVITLSSPGGFAPSPRWVETAADLALAGRSIALTVGYDDNDANYMHVARHLTEHTTRLSRKRS